MHILNRVKFRTPESVELEYTLAGIGNRAWALLIDYHILAVIMILLLITWLTVSVQLNELWKAIFGEKTALWLLAIASLIGFTIYAGYFVIFETLWQGQTPGKRFAKIRVVRDDGRPVGLQQTTLRALLRPVDEFLFIGAFLIMFARREKRLGDLAAGTIVIQQISTASKKFTISEQAKSLSEQLLEMTDLSAMLPDDFAVIREYLYRRSAMARKARTPVAVRLAQDVKEILNLENLPEDATPDLFLEAIYLAYQQGSYSS
ncbi:hypothetical protein NUACC21_40330 [Scytonema sp. NUACC21]